MYLCKQLTHASLPEIGRSFGGKHHSTVIHSIRKVEDLRKRDGDFNSLINNLLESFPVRFRAFRQVFHRSCAYSPAVDGLWTAGLFPQPGARTHRPASIHRNVHSLSY